MSSRATRRTCHVSVVALEGNPRIPTARLRGAFASSGVGGTVLHSGVHLYHTLRLERPSVHDPRPFPSGAAAGCPPTSRACRAPTARRSVLDSPSPIWSPRNESSARARSMSKRQLERASHARQAHAAF